MIEEQTALQLVSGQSAKPYRHLFRFVRLHFTKPVHYRQPRGFSLPDRVWDRQSALIMSLHETKEDG